MNSLKIKIILSIINTFLCGTRFFEIKNFMLRLCNVKIGDNTKIVGPIDFGTSIEIIIGDNCWIGKNFYCDGNGKVIISNNVDVAPHVVINTGGHVVGDSDRRAGPGIDNKIIVKSGTWIGTRATIINNTTIGSGVVVAAGTLVNKEINDNVLVAGVPAKVKKYL